MKERTAAELREIAGPEVDHLSDDELVELYEHLRYQARLMLDTWTPAEMREIMERVEAGEERPFDLPPSDAE